jgi:uncharacterized protein (TIGR03067 family)
MNPPCSLIPCWRDYWRAWLGTASTALVALAAGSTSPEVALADDRAISAGRWNVTAVESDGVPVDQEWLARLQVVYEADGSWAVHLRRIPVAVGRSTIRQDVSPKTFEVETLGSEGIKPSRFRGIYRLDGDVRVLCFVPEGTPRPDDFAAPRNSNRMLVTLKRAGDAPARARGSGPAGE